MSITSLYRRNVGGLDRGIRLLLGFPLLAAGLFLAGGMRGEPLGILVALAGLASLLTGITGRCPLYVPFGISTARPGANGEVAKRRMAATEGPRAAAPSYPPKPARSSS